MPAGSALLLPGFLDGPDLPSTRTLRADLEAAGFACHTVAAGPGTTTGHLAEIRDRLVGPTILIGFCYGAHLAVLAADERLGDVVLLMPTRQFIWAEAYDPAKDTWGESKAFVRGTRSVALPRAVLDDALRYDVDLARKSLVRRVLFVGGERDEVIGPDVVRDLYDECGSPDKTLRILPGVQHDYRDHPDQIAAVNAAVLEWLAVG
ncbi:hypothetical protein [Pseudonocardia xishanensis]|uniref:Alpha/beta hydrolase family protein n=1 Tax=Pseudonocardia xishanensis TaxID=630995 RepID=A0ABP8S663_9PSEU